MSHTYSRLADPEWTPYQREYWGRRLPRSYAALQQRLERAARIAAEPVPEPEPVLEALTPEPEPVHVHVPEPAPEPEPEPEPPAENGRVTTAGVIAACAAFAKMSTREIKSNTRAHRISRPRQAVMYLAAKHGRQSLPQIGRTLGGMHHTTIMHGRNKVAADLAAGGKMFGEIVEHVERGLGLR